MKVFITGGAGYIGSHTALELLRSGHEICVYDNFSNATPEALARVKRLANKDFVQVSGDIRAQDDLVGAMQAFQPDAVIHFAGVKAVGESHADPLKYYDNNVLGSLRLLQAMDQVGCQQIVFSSSATVYGTVHYLPYDEKHPLNPTNPYGQSKLMVERIIQDWCAAKPQASAVLLRYFNPAGAHESGDIGEDPSGVPNNLVPFATQVAVGRRPALQVFGNDYDTADGTGERDYIHVTDLALAHSAGLDFASRHQGCEVFNIGTGQPYSVMQIIQALEQVSGKPIPYALAPRRAGDIARFYAGVEKAKALLNWQAERDIVAICDSAWQWQAQNPQGYSA
ncbi:MAG: UDP-glucose 4-epimerase GalE [Pseudomonadota bacterium]